MNIRNILSHTCQDCDDYGLGEYVTIHITPEQQFSYVSFESNIPATSYLNIVTNVLNTFNPGKFILTIFATKVSTQHRHPTTPTYSSDLGSCSVTQGAQDVHQLCWLGQEWYSVRKLSGRIVMTVPRNTILLSRIVTSPMHISQGLLLEIIIGCPVLCLLLWLPLISTRWLLCLPF